jgi:hypothetical protein
MMLALLLKCTLFGLLSYSEIAIPLIFLTLAQWEVLFNAPDPSYSGLPLLLMILYCFALLQQNRLRRYTFVLALNFILIYTGYHSGSIPTRVLWCWRRLTPTPFGQALAGLLIAAASLASFFIHYEFRPGVNCVELSYRILPLYPQFVARMFSRRGDISGIDCRILLECTALAQVPASCVIPNRRYPNHLRPALHI